MIENPMNSYGFGIATYFPSTVCKPLFDLRGVTVSTARAAGTRPPEESAVPQ